MADLSNKALALLLLVAIVVSIGGTMVSLNRLSALQAATGFVVQTSDTGNTNFTIGTQLSIRFLQSTTNFGTGYVNVTGGNSFCRISTIDAAVNNSGCAGNFQIGSNLTVENDGNQVVNVSLNFTKNATGFIGGTTYTETFQYRVENTEANSCQSFRNASAAFTEVGSGNETYPYGSWVCQNFDFDGASNLFNVGFRLEIPSDASTGNHNVTITATACNGGASGCAP